MVINHNMSARFANRQLQFTQMEADNAMERLSSGMRINKAGDDASGLAVSEKMRAQIRGLNQATKNAQNGISFIQTTEGYLNQMSDIMQRMRELSVQAANGVYSDDDRMQIQVEVNQLTEEVDRIAKHAEFNKMNMLTGRFNDGSDIEMRFQIGANMDQNLRVTIGSVANSALFELAGDAAQTEQPIISISTVQNANMGLGKIDEAMAKVTKQRAELGAYQNRMEYMVKGLSIASENLTAAESRIRDTDMAASMVDYVKTQILTQSSAAMLASANTKNQAVMRVLG